MLIYLYYNLFISCLLFFFFFLLFFFLMIRRPPRSTRTDTLFPYTTLFRSWVGLVWFGIYQGLHPAQGLHCATGRAVFAADPAVVTQIVKQVEEIGVIHFTGVGLMPFWYAGDLYMAHMRLKFTEGHGDIAFHDLHVIEVHLHFKVGLADLFAYRVGLILPAKKIARHIAQVDGLDEHIDIMFGALLRGVAQILDESGPACIQIGIGGH